MIYRPVGGLVPAQLPTVSRVDLGDVERIPDTACASLDLAPRLVHVRDYGLGAGRRGPAVIHQRYWVLGANHGNLIPRPPHCRARYWLLEKYVH